MIYDICRSPTLPSENNIKNCPRCNLELVRTTNAKIVRCNLCNSPIIWSTMTLTKTNESQEDIGHYSNMVNEDSRIADVIDKIMTAIPNIPNKSITYTIYKLLAMDNELDRYIKIQCGGYTHNKVIDMNIRVNVYHNERIILNNTKLV